MKKCCFLFLMLFLTSIVSVSQVPFDSYINVSFTDEAISGMSLYIVPLINTVNPIVQAISQGEDEVTINTSSLPSGQYVLCLMLNGEVIQSLNIYKN